MCGKAYSAFLEPPAQVPGAGLPGRQTIDLRKPNGKGDPQEDTGMEG